jgi:hypothetical protein
MSDELKQQASIDTPEFRKMLIDFARRASYNISGKASPAALIAHIDAWGARMAVPDGWKLVPEVPTVTMHNAAALSNLCGRPPYIVDGRIKWEPADASAVYRAMLAAAPSPTKE